MDETRAVARLPHLDVEIVHRRLADQEAEQLAISLRATPSFDAFQRHLEAHAPFWPWLVPGLAAHAAAGMAVVAPDTTHRGKGDGHSKRVSPG